MTSLNLVRLLVASLVATIALDIAGMESASATRRQRRDAVTAATRARANAFRKARMKKSLQLRARRAARKAALRKARLERRRVLLERKRARERARRGM